MFEETMRISFLGTFFSLSDSDLEPTVTFYSIMVMNRV